jgi:hypothetical protein
MLKRTMFAAVVTAAGLLLVSCHSANDRTRDEHPASADASADGGWRTLALVEGGKVAPTWRFTGYGAMTVDNDVSGGAAALRTDCDARGLGLLVYAREKFGDCQIRVVYRLKDPRSNSGVYVRIADGILDKAGEQPPPATRDANGKLTDAGAKAMQEASEKELGPWYAVHHGYEVQIADGADAFHRTGAVYSLTKAEAAPPLADPAGWRTMLITLQGERVSVDVDGQRVSTFDAAAGNVPQRKVWHEPKREPKRPTKGYIGLQTHDPGDVVWFKEVSVRPL